MIVSFRIKNFMSFHEESYLMMQSSPYKEHGGHLITAADNRKLVKTLAVHGGNASGKTNLLKGLYSFCHFISFRILPLSRHTHPMPGSSTTPMLCQFLPFLLGEKEEPTVELEIVFFHGRQLFQYGFHISNHTFIKEQLTVDGAQIFLREPSGITPGRRYRKLLQHYTHISDEQLYISLLCQLRITGLATELEHFQAFFLDCLHLYGGQSLRAGSGFCFTDEQELCQLVWVSHYHSCTRELFRKLDLGIEDLIVEDGRLKTVHGIYNEDGQRTGAKTLDIRASSQGTIKYLALLLCAFRHFQTGGVLIVDGLSNHFHPTALKFFVDLYQSERNQRAQLIFSTYDIALLNNQQFRRDEVAFVDKNSRGESTLYTLADIKVRSDASFSKDYLMGKYGAIPIVRA